MRDSKAPALGAEASLSHFPIPLRAVSRRSIQWLEDVIAAASCFFTAAPETNNGELFTGQRRGDVVRMGWQHVKGDAIAVRQQK